MFAALCGYGGSKLIRYIWIFFNIIIWTSIWATIGIVFSIFDWSGRPVALAGQQWSKILLFISGIQYSVHGLEHLDPDQQYVFIANHESAFDILLVYAALPYKLVFMSKTELKKIPFLGWAMVFGKHIFVDRSNHKAALASMEVAKASLQKYPRSIMIFPEGTRSIDGQMKPFKKGGAILAIQTGLPLAPMAVCGTFDIVKKGLLNIEPKPIHLYIGQPLDTSSYMYDDRNRVTEILRNQIVNLKSSWAAQKSPIANT
ncbi:MAG TPA: lysophospholipid acyltransferase family protein [Candidatus Marinimicrobia bacterium]|jgi:1-acyl-sn-glycerol-3-phosphate acyltransferase|nr:1-acyl-sn-glycerol-3-phosphate acyltransferase [Candidatus Neomarinimicrobiota bacterium]HBN45398.1 1-acyl-sn-glycerol-3-phosphate acyltransferase [Candidatus Neomarinimicrobiota bacterium]HJL75567.1 lysophospholipid acyltransferase family protein [Candidatus Neomarinimicrobiota bacterium]HJM70185.1 lysophospholipid acyltransferase family protein [Candidatus Neomarinimicrobiota bacterium]|tara:strand:+ start:12367 stop:13140 length:774 start_codon:yes stop_codon:yes gene_type:complete